MAKQEQITKHHILAKGIGGTNYGMNIEGKEQKKHRAHHTLFGIKAPHEQIISILDSTGRAINKTLKNEIISVIDSIHLEDLYDRRCINTDKFIEHILKTKN